MATKIVRLGDVVEYAIGLTPELKLVWRAATVINAWDGMHPNLLILIDGQDDACYREDDRHNLAAPDAIECRSLKMRRVGVKNGEDVGCWRWRE